MREPENLRTESILSGTLRMMAETISAAEFGRLAWHLSALMRQPRGKGQPVIVLPGFCADDMSTWVLRRYLRALGYRAYAWRLGMNHGDVVSLIPHVTALTRECAKKRRQPVRLVGWSLGGLIAREVARDAPHLVDRVITLGTPTCIPRTASARGWYSFFGNRLDDIADRVAARAKRPLRVPVTAILAKYDGIVSACDCIDQRSERIEVATTHLGLGMNPDVYRIIAERLAIEREIRSGLNPRSRSDIRNAA